MLHAKFAAHIMSDELLAHNVTDRNIFFPTFASLQFLGVLSPELIEGPFD